jgi:hypothetical protein
MSARIDSMQANQSKLERLAKLAQEKQSDALSDLFPPERIKRIKRRELNRYKEAQDKKWRNWLKKVST